VKKFDFLCLTNFRLLSQFIESSVNNCDLFEVYKSFIGKKYKGTCVDDNSISALCAETSKTMGQCYDFAADIKVPQ
jgi:hypothetical protein